MSDTQQPLALRPRSMEHQVSESVNQVLNQLREILHRNGRLSTRHESLDEISKLLFAHFVSIKQGQHGISTDLLSQEHNAAESLQRYVQEAYLNHLPASLSHNLESNDFSLQLKASEDRLAKEIINCFQQHAPADELKEVYEGYYLDILNDTFGQFLSTSFIEEKELGQYLTPIEVVRFMVHASLSLLDESDLQNLSDPQRCEESGLILDPACGVGSFLAEVVRELYGRVSNDHDPESLNPWLEKTMNNVVVGIDKSERMLRLALTNLALFGAPKVNLHLANALDQTSQDSSLTTSLEGTAKLILTNPPFGAEFRGNDLAKYRIATTWPQRPPTKVDSELLFLERYIDWLAPNGILAAIVPDSILTHRGIYAQLRQGLAPYVDIHAVISLPKVTFGVAGTDTKTSILFLRRLPDGETSTNTCYFAICEKIGYEVATRQSQRRKIGNGSNDLLKIEEEFVARKDNGLGKFAHFTTDEDRWDATYHAGLPRYVEEQLADPHSQLLKVGDVASLSADTIHPRKLQEEEFLYIEISDVDPIRCSVGAKNIKCQDAPSRARKLVSKGDVLVSTVRPERRTIAVVPEHLDGAVCSTGFAVLRPKELDPLILARLLQSDFANSQILRNNVGISYPAIYEECLKTVVLPAAKEHLTSVATIASEIQKERTELYQKEKSFEDSMDCLIQESLDS